MAERYDLIVEQARNRPIYQNERYEIKRGVQVGGKGKGGLVKPYK